MLTIVLGIAAVVVIMGLVVLAMRAGNRTDRSGTTASVEPSTPPHFRAAHSRASGGDD